MEQDNFTYLTERLSRLEGELLGTQAALRGLLQALTDGAAPATGAVGAVERLLSVGLGKPVSDAVTEGIARAKARITPPGI